MSGGSGMIYALDLLKTLRPLPVETHLVISNGAKQVIPTELHETVHDLHALAEVVYKDSDFTAAISSGSYLTIGMVIVPCSAGTLAKVAMGITDTLLARAAHVTLKERRPLIAVVREAPYSRPMLKNMLEAFDAGATILPASPGFYLEPKGIDELVGTITARALDLLGLPHQRARRWRE
ncbi:MAG: UbiX family flavin prenyltransferase [Truepera sp.]|nr:UbiX family flavin prenyltransferase [Truepera sp.]